jgi:hypothetical protein
MSRLINRSLPGLVLLGAAAIGAPVLAQPSPAPAVANPLVSVSPNYVTIPMEIIVARPATQVWERVGKYCDIGEWLQIGDCLIRSGTGEIGTIRSVGEEVMVGKTPLSYTYAQTVGFQARGAGVNRPYDLYHGTLEARPIDAATSKLVYTLIYDNSAVPGGEAGKKADIDRRRAVFERALANMKVLAEGGTLPPPPARPSALPAPAAD